MSLSDAVKSGRLDGLRALRDELASMIEDGKDKKETAALARQLRECLREIGELEKLNPTKSVVDDLAAERKKRRANATRRARARKADHD